MRGRELVADEQVVDDVLHLDVVEEDVAAPVFLETDIALGLGVGACVDVVLLRPERVGGIEVLEVLHEPCAVESAGAYVAGQRGQPAPTEQAAGIAHRIVARPVGQRRAGYDQRPEQVWPDRRRHQQLPAGLTITDHRRLALASGMQPADSLDEGREGAHDILDGLAGNGIGQEAHEVARVTSLDRGADLAVGLKAADAGPMPGARVDYDERAPRLVGLLAAGRYDPHERIVGRSRQVRPDMTDSKGKLRTPGLPSRSLSRYWSPTCLSISAYRIERCHASIP